MFSSFLSTPIRDNKHITVPIIVLQILWLYKQLQGRRLGAEGEFQRSVQRSVTGDQIRSQSNFPSDSGSPALCMISKASCPSCLFLSVISRSRSAINSRDLRPKKIAFRVKTTKTGHATCARGTLEHVRKQEDHLNRSVVSPMAATSGFIPAVHLMKITRRTIGNAVSALSSHT